MIYTVVLQFPDGETYPLVGGGFTQEYSKEVRTWKSKELAELFAKDMCGKYDFKIIEVKK